MNVELHDEAQMELSEAALWYELQKPGLGTEFLAEIEKILNFLSRKPRFWRRRSGGYRRVNCLAFPYYLPYIISEDKVVVIAIAHQRRRHDYWRKRLKS